MLSDIGLFAFSLLDERGWMFFGASFAAGIWWKLAKLGFDDWANVGLGIEFLFAAGVGRLGGFFGCYLLD